MWKLSLQAKLTSEYIFMKVTSFKYNMSGSFFNYNLNC